MAVHIVTNTFHLVFNVPNLKFCPEKNILLPTGSKNKYFLTVINLTDFLTEIHSVFFVVRIKLSARIIPVLLTQYCAGDKIEKNEMGRTCSTDGGGERRV
jgi:hypothetical protein